MLSMQWRRERSPHEDRSTIESEAKCEQYSSHESSNKNKFRQEQLMDVLFPTSAVLSTTAMIEYVALMTMLVTFAADLTTAFFHVDETQQHACKRHQKSTSMASQSLDVGKCERSCLDGEEEC